MMTESWLHTFVDLVVFHIPAFRAGETPRCGESERHAPQLDGRPAAERGFSFIHYAELNY